MCNNFTRKERFIFSNPSNPDNFELLLLPGVYYERTIKKHLKATVEFRSIVLFYALRGNHSFCRVGVVKSNYNSLTSS